MEPARSPHPRTADRRSSSGLDGARTTAKVLFADMLTSRPASVSYGIGLAAACVIVFGNISRSAGQNVAGHECERDAGAYSITSPFDPRRHDRNIVVDTGLTSMQATAIAAVRNPTRMAPRSPTLARARIKSERQRDDYRGEPEIGGPDVQCDRDKYVGGNQQDDRNRM
jgi:hypothetical protein